MLKISEIELKKMIHRGKAQEVVDVLLKHSISEQNSDFQNLVILLSSRFNEAEKQNKLGTISSENFRLERAKFKYFLLEVIDSINFNETSDGKTILVNSQKVKKVLDEYKKHSFTSKLFNYAVISLFIISVISILFVLISDMYFLAHNFNNESSVKSRFDFSSLSIGLTGMIASGFFYFSNKLIEVYEYSNKKGLRI